MTYFLALDPGANSALGLVIGDQAWGFQCSIPEELEKAFAVLRGIVCGSYGSKGVIALEKVHSIHAIGAENNFQFGCNVGFWKGVLAYLRLPYIEVVPMTWQTAVTRKISRPDITGMTTGEIARVKREHKAALKQESIRSACKAFPRGIFSSHDVADAVNIARYLKLTYPEGITDMKCTENCMKTAKKMKIMKGKKASKSKVTSLGKKAGVSSKGAVKTKGKNLAGGVY